MKPVEAWAIRAPDGKLRTSTLRKTEDEEKPECFGTITKNDACYRLPCCKWKIKCKEHPTTPGGERDESNR